MSVSPWSYPAYDLVGGAPIDSLPYQAVSFGAPLNQPGSWQGSVSLQALASAQLDAVSAGFGPDFSYMRATEVSRTAQFVDLGGRLIWGGIVWSSDYDSADPQKKLTVHATEFGSWFAQRTQARDYTDTWKDGADPMLVAQEVIEDALAVASIMGGITLTLSPAGGEGGPQITPSYPGVTLQTIDSIVSILSQMGYSVGFDYSFDVAYLPGTRTPGITMNLHYPRQGRSADQSALVLYAKDCTFTYPVDGTQQATAVIETGSGTGSMTPVRASVALPDYPLLERTFTRSQINDERTLAAVALGDLGLYCYPVLSPVFTIPVVLPDPDTGLVDPEAAMPFGSFDRGDDFLFRVDPVAGGGLNVDPRFPTGIEFAFRINAWQCTVADHGVSTLQITAGVPPIETIPPPQPPL